MTTIGINDEPNEALPFEENFIEQAEYIDRERFLKLAAEHPHEAQDPSVLDVKSMNPKNTRSA